MWAGWRIAALTIFPGLLHVVGQVVPCIKIPELGTSEVSPHSVCPNLDVAFILKKVTFCLIPTKEALGHSPILRYALPQILYTPFSAYFLCIH